MTNELTVRLSERSLTELPPIEWNEAEVSAALDEMLNAYRGRQYAPEDIPGAKKDRAAVNKIEKQLAAAQKSVADFYKRPVEEFSGKMKLYREKVKEVSGAIDAQIKEAMHAEQSDKKARLEQVYRDNTGGELAALIPFERLLEGSWLNASFPFSTAKKELMARIETCRAELETLRGLCGEDFPQVERTYLNGLSIHTALAEFDRLAAQRKAQAAAEEARRQEQAVRAAAPILVQPTQEQREARAEGLRRAEINQSITEDGRLDFSRQRTAQAAELQPEEAKPFDFRAWLTPADIEALKAFFADRGIRYGRVPENR